jgi:hypothetical protein
MKKLLIFLLPVTLFLGACKKNNMTENSNDALFLAATEKSVIRYQFTADISGTYGFDTRTNDDWSSEKVPTAIYTKTVTVSGSPVNAYFTVFPPLEWENTTTTSDITMQIFLNDREIASKKAVMYFADRHPGINLSATIK